MLLLLPLNYLGPTDPHGGGCCLASVSRAFVTPLPSTPSFVNLTAEVIGQSPELLQDYLHTAATISAAEGDDSEAASASAAAIVQTVLAIVRFSTPFSFLLHTPQSALLTPPPFPPFLQARHPSLENYMRRPNSSDPPSSLLPPPSSSLPPCC
jgi:hypothetical protein